MNKQIRELHNLACRMDMEQHPDAFPSGERIQQRFAELIVQECVHAVRNRGGMCGALASNWIEEHFEVEE